jgi:hypothetical protein
MEHIEKLIEEFAKTKNGTIISRLNQMGVTVQFLPEGIRWSMSK